MELINPARALVEGGAPGIPPQVGAERRSLLQSLTRLWLEWDQLVRAGLSRDNRGAVKLPALIV